MNITCVNGVNVEDKCVCMLGNFGETCNIALDNMYPASWIVYQFFFAFSLSLLLLLSVYKLYIRKNLSTDFLALEFLIYCDVNDIILKVLIFFESILIINIILDHSRIIEFFGFTTLHNILKGVELCTVSIIFNVILINRLNLIKRLNKFRTTVLLYSRTNSNLNVGSFTLNEVFKEDQLYIHRKFSRKYYYLLLGLSFSEFIFQFSKDIFISYNKTPISLIFSYIVPLYYTLAFIVKCCLIIKYSKDMELIMLNEMKTEFNKIKMIFISLTSTFLLLWTIIIVLTSVLKNIPIGIFITFISYKIVDIVIISNILYPYLKKDIEGLRLYINNLRHDNRSQSDVDLPELILTKV